MWYCQDEHAPRQARTLQLLAGSVPASMIVHYVPVMLGRAVGSVISSWHTAGFVGKIGDDDDEAGKIGNHFSDFMAIISLALSTDKL